MRSLDNYLVIKAGNQSKFSFKEFWLYRELFYFFAWRDIKVRYKQTVIGAGWAILQPVLATAIFTIFFNRVAGIQTGGTDIPYPVFAYLGLMYWNMFSNGLNTISNSLLNNQGVLTKVYFPRLIAPFSAGIVSVIDFFFASIVFAILLVFYGILPSLLTIVIGLFALILMIGFAVGLGTFFAALNVKYRDVKTALPFLIQIMLFTTPIIYPVTLIPEQFRLWAYLNPATGAISSVRATLFETPVDWLGVLISTCTMIIILLFGIWYFKKTEKDFVDII